MAVSRLRRGSRDDVAERKQAHLDLCLREDVEAAAKTTLLEEVELVHDALPDIALDEVDLSIEWLGKRLAAPLLISSMTGGTATAQRINRDLASLAEEMGIAFGVGSQRAMQRRPGSQWTFEVREFAPTTVLLANLGLAQGRSLEVTELMPLVKAIDADALCLHLNVAQELIQPEGDRDFRGGGAALKRFVRELDVPIIAKETGCGISRDVGERLVAAGVRHVDVAGAGGTSWVRIEALRNPAASRLGEIFRDWGIPTAASLLELRGLDLDVVASGGIRNGLEVAKALALGASLGGVALPVYQAYRSDGIDGARQLLTCIVAELRTAMMLTGSRSIADLRTRPLILGARLSQWQVAERTRSPRASRPTPSRTGSGKRKTPR